MGVWLGVNAALFLWLGYGDYASDWALWRALLGAIAEGRIYDVPGFVWSPVLAPVPALVGLTGFWPQVFAHIAFVLLLRDRLMIVLLLTSFWFWPAVLGGNPLFTLTLTSAIGAFRGGRNWTLTYLLLAVLMPRPLQLPLLVWLLWKRPAWRLPFAAMLAAHSALVAVSGYLGPWMESVRAQTAHGSIWYMRVVTDIPLILRVAVAAVLTAVNRPGWAGVVASPYILQGYLLFPLLEVPRDGHESDSRGEAIAASKERTAPTSRWRKDRGGGPGSSGSP